MKLIIDIPDKTIAHIRADYGHNYKGLRDEDRDIIVKEIYNGVPLKEIAKDIQSMEVPKHSAEGFYICINTISKIFDNHLGGVNNVN